MVVHGEKNHRKGVPAEMAAPAEITSQRTQTSRHPGQPIAMSEKSSNFALAFKSIARSSHVHRVTIARTYTCNTQANMVFSTDVGR